MTAMFSTANITRQGSATPRKANAEVLYYACGGGFGHVTRATAILRQLQHLGCRKLLAITNSRQPTPLIQQGIEFLSPETDAPAVLQALVLDTLDRYLPQVLVIDVFAHGILGEIGAMLPALSCRKVLVYRHLRENSMAGMREALTQFDRVLLAEAPDEPLPAPTIACHSILIRDAEELLPRTAAKARLGVGADETVVLGVSSGGTAWTYDFFLLLQKAWRRLRPAAQLRLAAPFPIGSGPLFIEHYPLLELFNGVDLVVGASGYNLFHEAQACGIPAIFLPQPRRFDDQRWRARAARTAGSPEELESQLRNALAALPSREPADARYQNGALTAARAIA
ncbi:MAG TPA: hypothetical protein VGM23_01520, partial [Armatimonadota bacterium]